MDKTKWLLFFCVKNPIITRPPDREIVRQQVLEKLVTVLTMYIYSFTICLDLLSVNFSFKSIAIYSAHTVKRS